MEKYGFVYIWFDRYRHKFYIGCHWGAEDDGYICSSNQMRDAYRRRPQDFKRRILKRISSSRTDLLEEEFKWLQLIPDHELGVRYYNQTKRHFGHWTAHPDSRTIAQKISDANKGRIPPNKGKPISEATRKKLSEKLTGKFHSEETKRKISQNMTGRFRDRIISAEQRAKISASVKKTCSENPEVRIRLAQAQIGKRHSEETKFKMSLAGKSRYQNPEERKLQSQRLSGRALSETHKQKIAEGQRRRHQNKRRLAAM